MSTQVSPSSPVNNEILPLKEEYETKSGINIIQNQCELCGKILSNKFKKTFKTTFKC